MPRRDNRAAELRAEKLAPQFEALKGLAEPKRSPGAGDWLAEHSEPGQSVADYLREQRRDPALRAIYLLPLGDFSASERATIELTTKYLEIFFADAPVRLLPALALTRIPDEARRRNPFGGQEQILTGYVLERVLRPRRPADALALVALTAVDLYPDPSWNFVFGQASIGQRVGVWSLWRNGEPGTTEYLRRTIQTAAHETLHLLGVAHCIAWECLMNGSNHQAEKDRRPLSLCPSDLAKLCAVLGCRPAERARALGRFCAEHGLAADARSFEKETRVLEASR